MYELLIGKNLVTQVELSPIERSLAFLGVVTSGCTKSIGSILKAKHFIVKLAKRVRYLIQEPKKMEAAIQNGFKILDSAGEITRQLTPGMLKNYLSNVHSIPRETLVRDMESIGLRVKGQSPDGRFMEFIDSKGRVRAKIHPPDAITAEHHLHIYDSSGNSLNKVLEAVGRRTPDAHIPVGENL